MAKNAPKKNAQKAAGKDANKTRKKPQQNAPKRERTSIKEYFRQIKIEMKKVVWPTRNELGQYTVVVIAVCAFFAIGFWLIDSGFLAILRAIFNINI